MAFYEKLLIMVIASGFIWVIFIFYVVLSEFEYSRQQPLSNAKYAVRVYQEALTKYFQDNGIYPTINQGLQSLVTKPTTEPIPKNYSPNGYLVRLAVDPWGNPYQYILKWVDGKHKVTILSFGADGKLGGKGYDADIISE